MNEHLNIWYKAMKLWLGLMGAKNTNAATMTANNIEMTQKDFETLSLSK